MRKIYFKIYTEFPLKEFKIITFNGAHSTVLNTMWCLSSIILFKFHTQPCEVVLLLTLIYI